jgi:carboxymethylenebutenolidase
MSNLDFPAAVKELGEAVAYLKASGASKVGVVGFCMGGALSFAAAQHAGVDAAAPFYGIPDPAICDVSVLCCAVMCCAVGAEGGLTVVQRGN